MSIEDRLDHDVEAWRPEAGDSLTGKVVGVDSRDSDYSDEPYPLLEIETSDGAVYAFHAFHTVAKREISRLQPEVGDEIGIKYFGKQAGNKNSYEKYRVIVEKANKPAPNAPDWSAMRAEAEAEVESAKTLGVADPFELREDEEAF